MRLSPIAFLLCLAVFLIDATPAFTSIPTVIVYPLAASSATLDREASARISTTLAEQIAAGGHIKVVPPKIDTDREHYLSDARAAGASYYVTGFITPLGSGASVIEQVVSTTSGALVFSVSNYISSYAEVVSQGDQLREGIMARQQHAIAAFAAPPPAAATTPEPEPSKGTDVNVSGIFNHKKKGPLSVAALPPDDATIAVLAVGGSADSDARDAVAQALTEAFVHAGRHAVIAGALAPSPDVCAANKATVQIASWLDAPAATPGAAATLRMIAYDCNGVIAYDHTTLHRGTGITAAATSAAGDAVATYLAPARRG